MLTITLRIAITSRRPAAAERYHPSSRGTAADTLTCRAPAGAELAERRPAAIPHWLHPYGCDACEVGGYSRADFGMGVSDAAARPDFRQPLTLRLAEPLRELSLQSDAPLQSRTGSIPTDATHAKSAGIPEPTSG